MKILIIHPSFSPKEARGSEIIAQDTYKILKEHGHEVYFFATDKKPYLENAEWTKYFPSYEPNKKLKSFYNLEAQKKLSLMLDEIQPDIVHLHVHILLSCSIYKPIIENKIPIIVTVHDPSIFCPAIFGFDKKHKCLCKKCKDWNKVFCIINNCSCQKSLIYNLGVITRSLIEKFVNYKNKINHFITPSQSLANYITCKDIPKNKISVIPNFLNKLFVENIKTSTIKNDYFLYIGTLNNFKGVDILLSAIKELPDNIPFKIIGSGIHEMKYKKFAKENNLSNIEFLGNVDREKIAEYYQKSIAVIVPSNYFEAFGMINIEAFINNKPIIASNIGGIPEIVDDSVNGLLFEPANVEQLKECILTYWNNPSLAIEHGKKAYEKVKTQYTEERYYNELIKVYKEVLKDAKK